MKCLTWLSAGILYSCVGKKQNSEKLNITLIAGIQYIYYLFDFYIYPPDSHESDGGTIHRVSNYPNLLSEMPRYCCPVEIQ